MPSRILRRAATAALVLICVAALGACSSKEQKLARHLERAQDFDAKGQAKEALLELRSALQIDPKNADVNYRIADQLLRSSDFANAAFFFRETVRLDPGRTDAALAESKLILFDDTARADELVTQVLEREPKNVVGYVRKSEVSLARNDSSAALQAALTAVELDAGNGLAHMQLGIVQLARIRESRIKGEAISDSIYQDAERAFQRAAELFPKGHQARVELARLYAVWGGHEAQAEAAYRSAIEVAAHERARAASANAAVSYARATNRPEFLLWSLQELVKAAPDDLQAWDNLAGLEEAREKGAAAAVYQKVLETRPDDVQAHIHYAAFLVTHDRVDEAFAHLDAQVEKGVEPAMVLEEMTAMRLRRREIEPARALVERLTREHATAPLTERAKARLALAEGRLDEGADTVRRYLGIEDNAEGQRLLAMAELRRRAFPAAIAAIDRALQLAVTGRDELLRLKATIHSTAGDHAQTVQSLNRLSTEAGGLDVNERLLLAQSLYSLGRRPNARALLESLLAEERPPVAALVEFAQREGSNEPQRARDYLAKALERQPGSPQALRLMAQLDLGAGRPEAALARIDAAGAAGPLSPALLLLRAQVLAAMKDWTKAEEEARRAFAAAPSLPGALETLANIYVAQNRLAEAIASFEEAEKAGALPTSGQQLLARLHLAAGHPEQAKPLYEKVITARADLPGAKNDLAWILAVEGVDLERALTLAQEAQQAEPESPEVADTLGYVYLKKNLHDPALQQFQYAIELTQRAKSDGLGERPEYYYHAGLALQALGRSSDAASSFERALALDAKFSAADDARRQLEAVKSTGASGPG